MRRTYASIAESLGVQLCQGDGAVYPDEQQWTGPDHERGAWNGGVVHWRERRVTPAGLYRFLKLAAFALDEPHIRDVLDWRRTYLVHQAINRLAHKARVRVPAELSTLERRRVKAMLIHVPRSTPLRKEAFQWARR